MNLMRKLAVVIVALSPMAANADPIPMTYGFYQGGYEEGAFVTGFFRGIDRNENGIIESHRICATPTCGAIPDEIAVIGEDGGWELTNEIPERYAEQIELYGGGTGIVENEVTDFALFFSGNSVVDPFLMTGLEVLTSDSRDDGDAWNGLFYRIGTGVIPFVDEEATSLGDCAPFHDVVSGRDCGLLVAKTSTTYVAEWTRPDQEPFYSVGTLANRWFPDLLDVAQYNNGGFNVGAALNWVEPSSRVLNLRSSEVMRVFRVPEPGTLALFGIGLVGMAATRRRRKA